MQSGKMHEDYSAQTIIRGIRPEMLYKTGVLITCFKGTPLSDCFCLTSYKLVKLCFDNCNKKKLCYFTY